MDALDLGYHYDPLDYLLEDITLSASLTLANGLALGLKGSSFGINLQGGGNVFSTGSPCSSTASHFTGTCKSSLWPWLAPRS